MAQSSHENGGGVAASHDHDDNDTGVQVCVFTILFNGLYCIHFSCPQLPPLLNHSQERYVPVDHIPI